MTASHGSRSSRPACPEEALFVELLRTADLLSRSPTLVLREHSLSPNQYNVLRILRGAPEGLRCGEIAARMISREPDVTRLLDRLEKQGLIGRCREAADRRRVVTRISAEGARLLARLDEPVCGIHRRQLGHLGQKRLDELSRLLAACRQSA